MSTHRSKAYRAQQQVAKAIWKTLTACYGLTADGYTPEIAARVAAIHARLMDDKTGEYRQYLLDGGNMLGLSDSAQEAYKSFVEDDLSAADFDAGTIIDPDYYGCEG